MKKKSNSMNDTFLKEIIDSTNCTFVAHAFYDAHMDYIRIELRDCSTTEVRISEMWTVVLDNYPEQNQEKLAGIVIKGVRHLFTKHGIPLEGVLLVADVLDEIVKDMSEEDPARESVIKIHSLVKDIEMPIKMAA